MIPSNNAKKKLKRTPADVRKKYDEFIEALKDGTLDPQGGDQFRDHKLSGLQYPKGYRAVHVKGGLWVAVYHYEERDGQKVAVIDCFGTHQECLN